VCVPNLASYLLSQNIRLCLMTGGRSTPGRHPPNVGPDRRYPFRLVRNPPGQGPLKRLPACSGHVALGDHAFEADPGIHKDIRG